MDNVYRVWMKIVDYILVLAMIIFSSVTLI